MRVAIVSLIAVPLALASLPASAQSNPSSDQIINSLKPTGNMLQGGTRGIRMANPNAGAPTPQASTSTTTPQGAAPASTPAPASPAAAAPTTTASAAPAAAAPSVSLSVQFATDSADLTPQAKQTLDQLGTALTSADLSSYRFRIEGHTDTVGSPAYNKALSQRRANSVTAYLQSKFGVPAKRLEAVGMGEEGLLVPTPPQTANNQNRRVNVVNIGA